MDRPLPTASVLSVVQRKASRRCAAWAPVVLASTLISNAVLAQAPVIEQQHWLSDVVAGALVGIGSAKFVSGKLKIFGLRAPMVIIGTRSAGVSWTF